MSEEEARPRSSSARRAWYEDGLRFACQPDCGKCCTRHGEYDYVYLEGDDVSRLASHFALSVEEFTAAYTLTDDGHTMLRMDGPDCPFLDGTRCTVYGARPAQCETFPFWPENLKKRATWVELATFCPGIGRGELVPASAIRTQLRGRRAP